MTTCKLDPQLLWLVFALIAGTLVGFLSPSNNSKDPAPWNKLSHFTGWIYFFCWSVSFWPQIYMNYIRKSTEGLSFDYQLLNFIGFACYATFNLGLYYSPEIQLEYRKTHNNKESAVRFNDVLFAIHAFAATCITMFQIFWYRSNTQKTRQDRNNSTNSLQLDNPVGLYGLLSVPTDRQPLPPPKETKFWSRISTHYFKGLTYLRDKSILENFNFSIKDFMEKASKFNGILYSYYYLSKPDGFQTNLLHYYPLPAFEEKGRILVFKHNTNEKINGYPNGDPLGNPQNNTDMTNHKVKKGKTTLINALL